MRYDVRNEANSFTPALKKLLEVSRRHMFEEHILSAFAKPFAQVTRSMKTLVGSGHWLETQTNDRQKEAEGSNSRRNLFPHAIGSPNFRRHHKFVRGMPCRISRSVNSHNHLFENVVLDLLNAYG